MDTIWIDRKENIHNNGIKEYTFPHVTIYIDGLIYTYEKKAGKETVEWLYNEYNKNAVIPYNLLHGAFSCVIKNDNGLLLFTDNSNMHAMYYSNDFVSNSFLQVVKNEKNDGRVLQFNLEAICEYYTLGNIYFDKTFFTSIKVLNSSQVLHISQSNISIENKGIGDIDARTTLNSINEFFKKLAYSISDLNVCQALTGGYDSRMVFACLSNYISDHTAISANSSDHPDVKHAVQVAKVKGEELEIISTDKPVFSKKLLDEVLMELDGLQTLDIESNIRLLSFKSKLAKKYDLHLTGDGGVLHKDWEWTQDLPFYRKKKSDSKRFYFQRIYYLKDDNHLGEALREVFSKQQSRFTDYLDSVSKQLNTQSYDSWYYLVSGNRRVNYNNNQFQKFISYAPLNELDLVRYSYSLPRKDRFFYNSMRKTITRENVKIARIKTNYGTTASSEKWFLFKDSFVQIIEYLRKAIRLISRKLLNKTMLNISVLDWDLEKDIRNSNIIRNAITFAKNNRFILDSIEVDSLKYFEIQRLIHICWIHEFATRQSCKH